jgi:phosphoribosylformimino-5-aminoimidazole carboxamide ribotide isomerase
VTAELFPAIDLRDGKAVRLLQGDYDRETVYGDDPVAVAVSFVDAGARWIHVVDLDAARTGQRWNHPTIERIAEAVAGRARVQVGGGVRRVTDAAALAAVGVTRVVMGSAAVRHPELVPEVAAVLPVAVGLDHRQGELALHGWTEASGLHLLDVLDRYPDAAAFVITDISRDGMLTGPDVAGLTEACASTRVPVVASGGVAGPDDLRALAAIPGLAGIITGKALYEGRLTVAGALAVLGAGPRADG